MRNTLSLIFSMGAMPLQNHEANSHACRRVGSTTMGRNKKSNGERVRCTSGSSGARDFREYHGGNSQVGIPSEEKEVPGLSTSGIEGDQVYGETVYPFAPLIRGQFGDDGRSNRISGSFRSSGFVMFFNSSSAFTLNRFTQD